MKILASKLLVIFSFVFNVINANGQQSMVSGGGDISGTTGFVSYSIGQIVDITNSSSTGSVAQGVQQPYEISISVGIVELGVNRKLTAYPNPATDLLSLKFEDYNNEEAIYQLLDMSGQVLETKEITNCQTIINSQNLAPAIYFLRISIENGETILFKIVKI